MNKSIKKSCLSVMLFSIILCSACKKDWLNAKPDKALVVPTTVSDYQALLDNAIGSPGMNQNEPSLSMVGDGDYHIADADYTRLRYAPEKSAYIWAPTADFYNGQGSSEWISAYARILQSNVVLDGITTLKTDDGSLTAYNNVKGSALFYRSFDFYNLSQIYCKAYDATSATTDLGLPLRVSSNVNLTVSRSSLQQTYDLITHDLLQAAPLLPATPLYPTRPSKPAVFGLLARVYLAQGNYSKALTYADSSLHLQSALMDYNQLNPNDYIPIAQFNKEVIFHSQLSIYASFDTYSLIVDSTLYKSYDANDLRAPIFFLNVNGNMTYWGNYTGAPYAFFGGLATDEMYLIRAEAYARTGKTIAAMDDLNTLLSTRWKTGTYVNKTAASADAALVLIIAERRKELCFRNLRWPDLRRLNKDSRFQVTLTRTVSGKTYSLAPNSALYVLPLDPIEIQAGLQQNPR